MNGHQEAKEIAAHDLSLVFRRHFAVEQSVVFGDADVHQGKRGIAAEARPGRLRGP
jgi:hypothetical protein